MFLCLIYRKLRLIKGLQTLKIRVKIRPMPGNFTARALIMLKFGTNVLQSCGRYSEPMHDFVEFNPCANKRTLT